ncbi:MAG: PEP-CTERM sorting domain-containing protein, partial [Fimbriimonadaceae bacterium]
LVATLSGPGGTVDLFNRIGKVSATTGFGSSSDFGTGGASGTGLNYSFTTGGANLWTAALTNPIPAGTYAASSNLFGGTTATSYVETNLDSAVNGSDGVFTLTIRDLAGGDVGAFDGFEIEAVPEPATLAALGLGAFAVMRRRRSAK